MNETTRMALWGELDEIVHDPIRGLRLPAVQIEVVPRELAVVTERPGALRRLLGTLIAAASWGGGLSGLQVTAAWEGGQRAGEGELRLGLKSRRNFQDAQARAGWQGIEQVLLDEVRRALDLVGGGELIVHSGGGDLACEVRLTGIERAQQIEEVTAAPGELSRQTA